MNRDIEISYQRIPGGVLTIFFRAFAPIQCDAPLLELGEFEIRELCNTLGDECRRAESASGVRATELSRAKSRFVLVNGWQSWSFAGELAGGERPRRACIKRDLNLFADHPAEAELRKLARRFGHRHDYISHFMLGLRAGELRLLLASDNVARDYGAGSQVDATGRQNAIATATLRDGNEPSAAVASNARAIPQPVAARLPPLSFLLRDNRVRVFAYAEGGVFERGEVIARVSVLIEPNYFSLKDRLSSLWGASARFDDLRWLAAPVPSALNTDGVNAAASAAPIAISTASAAILGTAPAAAPAAPIPNSVTAATILGTASAATPAPTTAVSSPYPGVIGGYASWYNHYTNIDERIIGEDLAAIRSNNNFVNAYFIRRGAPAVFQIDDGWQTMVGDWTPHPVKFPGGMAIMGDRIRQQGLIPGIWLAPFLLRPDSETARAHPEWLLRDATGTPVKAGWNPNWGGDVWCLDLSLEQVESYLIQLFDRVVNSWGFRYLKLDFLYAGLMRGKFAGRKGGAWQHYARIMARILEFSHARDGTMVAFLSCGAPIEPTAPFMPLMRSGADTREHWEWPELKLIGHQGRPSAKMNMRDSIGRALLDKTLLLCDPDVIFCRTERISLRDTEKFLVGMCAAMFGSQLMVSDDPASFGATQPPPGRMSESEFTAQLIEWLAKLDGREFAVQRSARRSAEVYHFYSRDGSMYGGINLSEQLNHFMLEGAIPIPPHSLLIFGA